MMVDHLPGLLQQHAVKQRRHMPKHHMRIRCGGILVVSARCLPVKLVIVCHTISTAAMMLHPPVTPIRHCYIHARCALGQTLHRSTTIHRLHCNAPRAAPGTSLQPAQQCICTTTPYRVFSIHLRPTRPLPTRLWLPRRPQRGTPGGTAGCLTRCSTGHLSASLRCPLPAPSTCLCHRARVGARPPMTPRCIDT